jgi:hypothetical protein
MRRRMNASEIGGIMRDRKGITAPAALDRKGEGHG